MDGIWIVWEGIEFVKGKLSVYYSWRWEKLSTPARPDPLPTSPNLQIKIGGGEKRACFLLLTRQSLAGQIERHQQDQRQRSHRQQDLQLGSRKRTPGVFGQGGRCGG